MGLFGDSKNPEDYVYEGLAMLQQNKPKAAVNLFKKALKSDSKISQHFITKVLR